MPFISEAASAIKNTYGLQDLSSDTFLLRRTPDLLKSSAKESIIHGSSIRNIHDLDEDGVSSSQSFEFCEDPSFWKEHNVQVKIR